MVLQLDGKKVPKIFMGNSKIYDIEELPEPEIVKDNLILHYDFSQGDNNTEDRGVIKDLSGNGNDGVLHNFDYSEESGYVENGLRFDGIDDEIKFNDVVFAADEDFTIEILVKERTGDSTSYILGDMNSSSSKRTEFNYSRTGWLDFNRYGMSSSYVGYENVGHEDVSYAIHSKDKIVQAFSKGLPVKASVTITDDSSMTTLNNIGMGRGGSRSNYFSGVISGVRIYKRALSEGEIAKNYTIDNNKYFGAPLPEPPVSTQLKLGQKDISLIYKGDKVVFPNHTQDGLKLWYDFSSMSTDPNREFRVKDLSGNGNDGSLANFKHDDTDGYMNKGLMFNGEGSEVNFPKMTFEPEEDWTVEIVLDKSTGIKPDAHLFGDKVNYSYITFYIDEQYSWDRYGRIYYSSNDFTSSRIEMNENSPNFVHMIISKKDGVVSAISGDNPNVIHTTIAEHEQNFDNLGFAYRYNTLDYAFKGLVHSVRVYDRALTQEEITQNYKLDKGRYGI